MRTILSGEAFSRSTDFVPFPLPSLRSRREQPRCAWGTGAGTARGQRRSGDAPRVQGVTLAGGTSRQKAVRESWGKALPCLQGGRAGAWESSVSPLGCGERGLRPPYRVAPLSGQTKERNGKMPGRSFAQRASRGPSSSPRPLLPRRSTLELEDAAALASPFRDFCQGTTTTHSGLRSSSSLRDPSPGTPQPDPPASSHRPPQPPAPAAQKPPTSA